MVIDDLMHILSNWWWTYAENEKTYTYFYYYIFLLIIIRDYKKSAYTFNYITIKENTKKINYFYTCQSKKSSIMILD